MLGLGLSIPQLAARGLRISDLAAAIRSLFAAGEQGVWYDPSDMSTMFQDAAGTTPVTAVEQPVGLILDKSKGLVLGPELVTNGDFSNGTTGWNTSSWWTISSSQASMPSTTAFQPLYQASDYIANRWYRIDLTVVAISGAIQVRFNDDPITTNTSDAVVLTTTGSKTFYLFANTGTECIAISRAIAGYASSCTIDNISVRELPGNHATQTTSTSRPVLSARVNLLTATETLTTQTVATRATAQTLRFEGAGTVTLSGTATGTYSAGSHSVTTTVGNLTLTVSGTVTKADLRAANMGIGLPAYQRVNTAIDYDTVGFPHYLRFDGVDDSLVTNSIDFTATDKMTVFAGVRKLSDSAAATVAELSANSGVTPNTFAVFAPGAVAPNYAFRSSGTSDSVATATTFASPITNVLVGLGEVASDTAILRIDGTQAASSTADQGTGNYGNYPLYIGRRGGTTLPFNGHLYSLIVRGAQSTDQQIIDAEKYVNDKTRAYA